MTLAAVDNDVDAADKAVTVSGAAGNDIGVAGPADVALTIEDDDERGVTVSETELGIDEGGTGTYTVVLDSEPTASVTVTPSRSSGSGDVTVSGALTFTAANWDTAQTVTVGAAEDGDAEDDTAAIGHSVSGGDYDSETAASVDVTVDDDETPSTGRDPEPVAGRGGRGGRGDAGGGDGAAERRDAVRGHAGGGVGGIGDGGVGDGLRGGGGVHHHHRGGEPGEHRRASR